MAEPTLPLVRPDDGDPILAAKIKAAVWQRLQRSAGVDAPTNAPRIGRFTVLNVVGRGGTGVVYAVYDEQLDRRAALKLIHGTASPELHARMQREARALARLSHPNVVPVFEVGNHDDLVFIVMEYVRGETLRQWVRSAKPTVADILDKYLQAGRGLAAAHAAGMVHRDFKPDNAIVGEGGRVRVLDFGLARTHAQGSSRATSEAPLPLPRPDAFDTPLTVTGSIMGTPAYMASEQLLGEPSDHRSDQFAFCVALWEALCGERPYRGSSLIELGGNVTRGDIRTPPRESVMPAWVRPLLERGLGPDPDARWPAMDDLLGALERGRRPRRTWAWLGLGVGTLAAIAAAWGLGSTRADACVDGEARIARVWNDDQREAVRHSLVGVDTALAATTAERVDGTLSSYAEDWLAGYRDACEASKVRGEQSEALMQQRMRCLSDRERRFGALVGALETITDAGIENATQAALSLPPVASCADPSYVESDVPPPHEPELAAAVDELDAIVARSAAHERLAAYDVARSLADEAFARARELEHPPLLLRAATRLASAQFQQGQYDAALATAHEGFVIADGGARIDAATNLEMIGEALCALGKYDQGLVYFRKAFTLRESLAGVDTGLGFAASLIGYALSRLGRHDEAIGEFEHALAIIERTGERLDASIRAEMANTLYLQHEPSAALELHRAALVGFVEQLGDEHPYVAQTHGEIALDLSDLGRADEALVHATKGHAILLASGHVDDRSVTSSHSRIGTVLMAMGRHREALAHYEAVRAGFVRMQRTRSHIQFAIAEDNVGRALVELGRADEALASHREYLADVVREVGPEHEAVAEARDLLGRVLNCMGRHDEALVELQAVRAIRAAAEGDAAASRLDVAATLDLLGRTEEALAEYRGVLASATEESAEGRMARALIGTISAARRLGRQSEATADLALLRRTAAAHSELPDMVALVALAEAIASDSRESVSDARDRLRLLSCWPGVFVAEAWLTDRAARGLSSDP